jgi:hypothetical protein
MQETRLRTYGEKLGSPNAGCEWILGEEKYMYVSPIYSNWHIKFL